MHVRVCVCVCVCVSPRACARTEERCNGAMLCVVGSSGAWQDRSPGGSNMPWARDPWPSGLCRAFQQEQVATFGRNTECGDSAIAAA